MGEPMDQEAAEIIQRLQLQPHPEGGFYRETFRAPLTVTGSNGESRAASTAIYFLLPAGGFSAFHRVRSDEVWHHYAGDPLELHLIAPDGRYEFVLLGDECPQYVVPAGVWQAAIPARTRYVLCGCTVAPGFDFADFEMPARSVLEARFPQHSALFARLCR